MKDGTYTFSASIDATLKKEEWELKEKKKKERNWWGLVLGGVIGAGAAVFAAPLVVGYLATAAATTAATAAVSAGTIAVGTAGGACIGYVVADSTTSDTWIPRTEARTYKAHSGH